MVRYGLLGETLGHSLSPEIHTALLEALQIPGTYELCEVPREKVKSWLMACKEENWRGVNVTIPYKECVIPLLDYVSPEATRIGAVNTIVWRDGKAHGYNTDYDGFGRTFARHGLSFRGRDVVVLGYGGGAKAVLSYVGAQQPRHIWIVQRPQALVALEKKGFTYDVESCSFIDYEGLAKVMPKDAYLINTTPVGMYPHVGVSPVPKTILSYCDVVMDLVYNPLETQLLADAAAAGCHTLDGLYMLVAQAARAQEIFQQTSIPESIVIDLYERLRRERMR